MSRHTLTATFASLAAATCITLATAADVPRGAVRIPADGYLYAEHSDDLADATDGLTIEAWFWLTRMPPRDTAWPLIKKAGSYSMALASRSVAPLVGCSEGVLFCAWYDSCGGALNGPLLCVGHPAPAWPTNTWVHLAYQVQGNSDETYVNGEQLYWGQGGGCGIGAAVSPLFVGGLAEDAEYQAPSSWESPRRTGRMEGWVDEVRISRGRRYQAGGKGQPIQGEGPDENTIAVWTFDEAPSQGPFPDKSGNGHALFGGGTLALRPNGNLAATWAHLKKR